jgi:hypothetical protein
VLGAARLLRIVGLEPDALDRARLRIRVVLHRDGGTTHDAGIEAAARIARRCAFVVPAGEAWRRPSRA